MTIAISYAGSFTALITNICLEATSVVGIAHSLPTAPDIGAVRSYVCAANTTLATPVSMTMDATTITFSNAAGDKAVLCNAWAQVLHSITR